LSTVTLKQFNTFLAAKAPEKPCPECGTHHWLVETDKRDPEPMNEDSMIFRGIIPSEHGTAIPIYPMLCANCGFVKSFAATLVENWTAENG
jgi:predicted RNA-binding Zn-ribbon protein involved in translation (DUF1610 family)